VAEYKGKEEEKFDFTAEAEELGYFTLDQTILLARQNPQVGTTF
jgi:hypothetical protein